MNLKLQVAKSEEKIKPLKKNKNLEAKMQYRISDHKIQNNIFINTKIECDNIVAL